MEITLDDVESAIMILKEFLKKQREAQSILRQMGVREKSGVGSFFNMEKFAEIAAEQVEAKRRKSEGLTTESEPTVSDADLKRMREITEKRKAETKP